MYLTFTIPDPQNDYGCVSDVIRLSCVAGVIYVTNAKYGMYSTPCTGCCPPNATDCTELVSENRPEDWVSLKYQCDNKTSCEFQYRGSVIDQCQEGYIADYMDIDYDCRTRSFFFFFKFIYSYIVQIDG